MISSELEEVVGLCHRVLVMREGRCVGELKGDAISEAAILAALLRRVVPCFASSSRSTACPS